MVNESPSVWLVGSNGGAAAVARSLRQRNVQVAGFVSAAQLPSARDVSDAGEVPDALVYLAPQPPQPCAASQIASYTATALADFVAAAQRAVKVMAREGSGGAIVAVLDIAGVPGRQGHAAQATLSGALIGAGKCLAKELGRQNISVNMVGYGFMPELGTDDDLSKAERKLFDMMNLGKSGSVEHLVENIVHLIGNRHLMTGQVLQADDGLIMKRQPHKENLMQSMIEVKDVHKHYQMGKAGVHALRGVNLNVRQGERVFLGGPSGCGKSTLLHLIGGLDRPSEGTVSIGGRRIDETGDDALSAFRAQNIGFVFQNFNLMPVLTVAENVEHPLLLTRQSDRARRVAKILQQVGLAGLHGHYPSELSGGQRQRVAIARALVHKPLLLIADEPTANLDSETGEHVLQLMLDLSRESGSTVLICTHNTGFLQRAERVVTMSDGKVASDVSRSPAAHHCASVVSFPAPIPASNPTLKAAAPTPAAEYQLALEA